MGQRFIARERHDFTNGAVGWAPGGPFDCIGPYARVQNCPIAGTDLRLTCYGCRRYDVLCPRLHSPEGSPHRRVLRAR